MTGPSPPVPVIELAGVTKDYGEGEGQVRALRGIDLVIRGGEFLAVMGPSGSGKSTCMNILGCLDTPTAGTYRFLGVPVGSLSADQRALLRRNYLGFVFQGFNLLSRTTALENVELPLVYRHVDATERRERARKALLDVGLGGASCTCPASCRRPAAARRIARDRRRAAGAVCGRADRQPDTTTSYEIMTLLTGSTSSSASRSRS
jgi:putative ABC transport system ATP-binding protein